MTELELRIYDIVRRIPEGRVATYGQVALATGDRRLARVVGNVMHKNPVPFWELARQVGWKSCEEDAPCSVGGASCGTGAVLCGASGTYCDVGAALCGKEEAKCEGVERFAPVPCHRVVNASGKMGANFGMGGPEVQAAMLKAEGVEVGDDFRIVGMEKYLVKLDDLKL